MKITLLKRSKPDDYLVEIIFIDSEADEPLHSVFVSEKSLTVMIGQKLVTQLTREEAEKRFSRYFDVIKHAQTAEWYLFSAVRERDTTTNIETN